MQRTLSLFYSGPQIKREINNDLNFVVENVKTEKQQKVHYNRPKNFNSRSAITDKNESKNAQSEPRIPQNDLTEDNNFVEIEVVTPKLNDTGRREVNPEGNKSQNNPSTETHNETVKDELLKTPMGGSTRESKNTNTQQKQKHKDTCAQSSHTAEAGQPGGNIRKECRWRIFK